MIVSDRKTRLGNGRGIFATAVVQMQGGDREPLSQSAQGRRRFDDMLVKVRYLTYTLNVYIRLENLTWNRIELNLRYHHLWSKQKCNPLQKSDSVYSKLQGFQCFYEDTENKCSDILC